MLSVVGARITLLMLPSHCQIPLESKFSVVISASAGQPYNTYFSIMPINNILEHTLSKTMFDLAICFLFMMVFHTCFMFQVSSRYGSIITFLNTNQNYN